MYFPSVPYVFEFALAIAAAFLYHRFSPFNYWTKIGVPQIDRKIPIIGFLMDIMFKPLIDCLIEGYKTFPDEKIVGAYDKWKPILLIRDPNLIECFLIKEFSHFYNRGVHNDPNGFFSKHLLNVQNEQWKSLRTKLNPTFTSGKLKGMHSQLIECGESLMKFFESKATGEAMDVRDGIQRFTMDVIASCAFGLNIDTINNPDSEFRTMGLRMFKRGLLYKIDYILGLKPILRKLKLEKLLFQERKYKNFTADAMKNTIEHREKNKVTRNDFLHLMNELRKKDLELVSKGELAPNDQNIFDFNTLVSSSFVFFLAGFETTATTITYALYELALNQDVQNRLYNEISHVLSKHNGEASYDALQEMSYLQQVLTETLRKYPPVQTLTRRVTREYRIPNSDLVLPVGMKILIPTYAIHHDPQYYPEPEKFLPERFDEETNNVQRGTFLPFGLGPRICIGERFAKLEAKLCLALILNEYRILKTPQTKVPLTFNKNSPLLTAVGGIWLAFQNRNHQ